jgi:hypothetical protein
MDAASPNNPSSVQTIIEDQAFAQASDVSQQSSSYNDVFFQRRLESNVGGSLVNARDVIGEATLLSTTEAHVVSESALVTISVTPIVSVQSMSADSPIAQENIAAAERVESDGFAKESDADRQSEVQTSNLKAHDSGFFQRIFGKFRKE